MNARRANLTACHPRWSPRPAKEPCAERIEHTLPWRNKKGPLEGKRPYSESSIHVAKAIGRTDYACRRRRASRPIAPIPSKPRLAGSGTTIFTGVPAAYVPVVRIEIGAVLLPEGRNVIWSARDVTDNPVSGSRTSSRDSANSKCQVANVRRAGSQHRVRPGPDKICGRLRCPGRYIEATNVAKSVGIQILKLASLGIRQELTRTETDRRHRTRHRPATGQCTYNGTVHAADRPRRAGIDGGIQSEGPL